MSGLLSKIGIAYRVFRTEGFGAVVQEAAAKLGTVETYVAYRADLTQPLPPLAAPPALTVRKASEADFRTLRETPRPLSRHAEFHDRFGLDQCYLAFAGSDLAHVAWIYYPDEQRRHPTRFRHLQAGEACIANCLTMPAHRGRGIYPATLQVLLRQLREEGYRTCYMYVERENVASQRGVTKAGFVPAGHSWRVRLFYHYPRDPAAGFYIQGRTRAAAAAPYAGRARAVDHDGSRDHRSHA